MITNDELDLIELTLEQEVDDVEQLVNRAITLHAHCSALLAEVKRQRALLALGVRVVGPSRPSAVPDFPQEGDDPEARRWWQERYAEHVAAAGDDASVDRTATVPTLDDISDAILTCWTPREHGQLCPRWTRRGINSDQACTCWIGDRVRKVSAAVQALLIERGEHVAAAEGDAS